MHHIRQHLTFANVVSSLGAIRRPRRNRPHGPSFVVSEQSGQPGDDLRPQAASGNHANIIPGSINGQDVQDLGFTT